jgi:flagellin
MSSVIYTNTASLVAQKNLLGAQNALATSVERLSSGLRINRARDDAAGLSVANSLQTQINGANQGIRNMNDAISMVQTAEGAIAAASDMGQRILTLATQGANGTLGPTEKDAIITEMKKLMDSISSIAGRTSYSGNSLLSVSAETAKTFKGTAVAGQDFLDLGADAPDKLSIDVGGTTYTTAALADDSLTDAVSKLNDAFTLAKVNGYLTASVASPSGDLVITDTRGLQIGKLAKVDSALSIDGVYAGKRDETNFSMQISNSSSDVVALTGEAFLNIGRDNGAVKGLANALNTKIGAAATEAFWSDIQFVADSYVKSLSSQRSLLGAYQNQMEYTLANITELSANLSASKSRVIDTDYASETASLTRGQILQQAATAMLAQANQMPNVILTLLK